MPGGDRTGPMGGGPKTGRAAGYCAGFDGPGSMNTSVGRGGGFGAGRRGGGGMRFGRGRGGNLGRGGGRRGRWRWLAFPRSAFPIETRPVRQPGTQSLEDKLERTQSDLADIRDRLKTLESTGSGRERE